MKTGFITCDPDVLIRYMDQELGPQEHAEVGRHLKACKQCQHVIDQSQSLSVLFKDNMDRAVRKAPLANVERAVMARIAQQRGWWQKAKRGLLTKRMLVPAGAIAAVMSFFVIFFRPVEHALEPSAIINSFTAETSSVMILETPNTRQTILWFEETPGQGGENDGMEQV